MKVLIVGIIVLALAVAGVSTYLIQTFSGEENIDELQKEAQKPEIRVLIAARDIRPGETITPDVLAWQAWVDESINKQFVVVENDKQAADRTEEFNGAVVRHLIREGEPILAAKIFKREKSGYMAGLLKSGMRAVTFAASPNSASGGFILPGDRVDLLLTHDKLRQVLQRRRGGKPSPPDEQPVLLSQTTETILRDVLVLAVNTVIDVVEGNSVPAASITLELTAKQAELMITARTMGKISMVLRSLERPDNESNKPSFTTDVEASPFISNLNASLEELEKRRQMAGDKKEEEKVKEEAKAAPVVMTPKPEPPKRVIKIYRGTEDPEEVEVKR